MTNQEAIRLIRNLPTMCVFTDGYGTQIDSDAYYDAVDMAIEALKQPERKKGHKVIHNRPIPQRCVYVKEWGDGSLYVNWDKTGKPLILNNLIEYNPVEYCSECGKRLDDTFQNFCSNCGADMRGDGDESN